jgi:hypothetical protein
MIPIIIIIIIKSKIITTIIKIISMNLYSQYLQIQSQFFF